MKKQFKLAFAIFGLSATAYAATGLSNSLSVDDLIVNASGESIDTCVKEPNKDCHSGATGNIYIGRSLKVIDADEPGETPEP